MASDSLGQQTSSVQPEAGTVHREVVAIGASAGGVEAVGKLVADLPPELPAALLIVLHVLPTGTSMLPAILQRAGRLPATSARHGEPLERGHIYVAPPDHHLLVRDGQAQLSHGPRENGHRPALDPLFRSAARVYGRRAIGVVLSGTLDDGTAGLTMIRRRGGATIAQNPKDALYGAMPKSAIDNGAAEHVATMADMADLICSLIDTPVDAPAEVAEGEVAVPGPTLDTAAVGSARNGEPSGLTCPECGGALWEHQEGELIRFRCHVGHAYSPESMQTEQGRALETALWSALRSLEERQDLLRRMARRARMRSSDTASRFESRADDVALHADAIRRTIAELGRASVPNGGEEAEPAA